MGAPGASTEGRGPAGDRVGVRTILSDPAVRTAVLIIFVVMMGFGVIAPILPLYARSFGVSYRTASLLISAFALARLVTDPVAGPIVDRFGERAATLSGVLVVGASSLLAGLAPTFPLAVLFRGAGGAGSALFFAALYSYLLKVVPSDRMARTLSLFLGSLNVGIIAGGPVGGVVASELGLNAPLFVYAGLCAVAGALCWRFMPAAPRGAGGPGPADPAAGSGVGTWERVRALLRTPAFVTVVVLNLAFFWVVAGGYDTLIPLFGREGLGMSEVGVGGLFALVVLGEFVALYPAGSAADRVGRRRVLLPALAGLAAMLVLVGWAGTPAALAALMVPLGLASGSTAAAPGAMLSDVTPGGGSGTAVGLFRFAGDLGFVLGPLAGGAATQALGFRWAFGVMAVPVVVALVQVARTPETLRRPPARPRPVPPVDRSPLAEG